MIAWVDPHGAEPVTAPAAVLLANASVAERREALRRLAARVLGEPDLALLHREGFAPRIAGPDPDRLRLTSASRGGIAALAVADQPIGIDVELAEPGAEPPWAVLHPIETEMLRALSGRERGEAFARLWSAKEAYLKALRRGLSREPGSFAVSFGGTQAIIDDPSSSVPVAYTETRAVATPAGAAFVTVVLLARGV